MRFRDYVLTMIAVLARASTISPTKPPPPAETTEPARAAPSILQSYKNDMRWWLPTSFAVVSIATIFGVYFADVYYNAYFEAFGLNPAQVGLTKTDIVFRVIPLGVLFGVLVYVVRVAAVVAHAFFVQQVNKENARKHEADKTVPKDESEKQRKKRERHEARRERAREKAAKRRKKWEGGRSRTFEGIAAFVCVVATIFVFGFIVNQMSAAGARDARHVITSPYNYLYFGGFFEERLRTATSIAEVQWIGPVEEDILTGSKKGTKDPKPVDPGNGRRYTLARVIVQSGETTIYFDLLDCSVYFEPTIDLSITTGILDYRPTAATSPIVRSIKKPCQQFH